MSLCQAFKKKMTQGQEGLEGGLKPALKTGLGREGQEDILDWGLYWGHGSGCTWGCCGCGRV